MDKPSTTINPTEYDSKTIQRELVDEDPDKTSPQSTDGRDPQSHPANHPSLPAQGFSVNAESVSVGHLMESLTAKDDLTAEIGESTSSFDNIFITIENQ